MAARFICIALLILTCGGSPLLAAETGTSNMVIAKYDDSDNNLRQKKQEATRRLLINESYEYYEIDGSNIDELRQQMKQRGTKWNDGKVYAALTTWDIGYDYDVSSADGKYFIKSADTKIGIVFHLPRRQGNASNSEQLVGQWDKYMEHLKEHEFGHRDLAVKAAGEINEILASLGSFSSRSELDKEATRLVKAKLKAMKEIQVKYDADTHHGIKQGAVLSSL
ncbi:MAG TPA: DUF922 domain-containing protein [Desulfuromonadaceae bacterium]|jgi:predicted secreted Zn-dependent protease